MSEKLPPEQSQQEGSTGPRSHSLTATAGDGSVSLSWTTHTNSNGFYKAKRRIGISGNFTTIAEFLTGLSYTDTTVNNGTTYQYQIETDLIGGGFSNSNTASATPTAPTVTAPGTPTGLSTTVLSTSSIRLNWNQGSGDSPTHYETNIQVVSSGVFQTTASTTSTSRTFSGLDSNTQYRLWVRAVNSAGNSGWASRTATTDEEAVTDLMPTAPNISNKTATVGSSFSTTLTAGSGGNPPLSYTASPLPAGLSFNTSSRVISGTPTTVGSTTVTYRVTDTDGDSDTDTFTITVSAAPTTAPGVPTSVSLTTIDHDSVRLTWSAGSGGTPKSYQVQTREGISGGWTSRGTQSSGYTLNGLEDDTLYQGRVRATNSAGSSAYSSPDSTTTDEQESVSFTVTATAGDGQVSLSWTSHPDSNGFYKVQRATGGSFGTIAEFLTGLSYTDTNVNNGTTYQYQIETDLIGGGFSRTNTAEATPTSTITAPGVPTSVSLTTIDHDSVRLTWSAGSGDAATSYQVQTREGIRGNWTNRGTQSSGYTLNGLEADTLYQGRVRATNSAGSSAYSSPDSTTTDPEPVTTTVPGVPTSVSLTTVDHDTLRLSWSAGSGGTPTSYQGEYREGTSGEWTSLGSITSAKDIGGLEPETLYQAHVRATNSEGSSAYSSPPASATTEEEESVSFTVTATAGDDQVSLSWTSHPDGNGSYKVLRATGGSFGTIAEFLTGLSYTDTTVNNGTTYQYQIETDLIGGGFSRTNTAEATPTSTITAPGVPTSVSLTTVDHDSVRLTWSAGSGDAATSYQVETREGTSGGWTSRGTQSSGYTLNGLEEDTLYQGRVRATNSAGSSTYSSPDSTTTDAETATTAPGAPTSVSAAGIDHDTINVQWSAPTSGGTVATYDVRYRESSGSYTTLTGITTLSRQIHGLNPSTTYQAQVQAVNSVGSSKWTPTTPVTATTTAETATESIPSAPRRLVADAQSSGVVIDWLTPEEAGTGGAITGYNIWRWHKSHTGGWLQIAANTNSTATNYTDTAILITNDTYWYVVRAINSSGDGKWSDTASAVFNPTVPSAPRRLLVDAQSTGVVMVWLAPVDTGIGGAITGYNIWRSDGVVFSEIVADTGSTALTYTDTATLVVGLTYGYAIRAINSDGIGEWSETSDAVINPALPSAPRRLTVEQTNSGIALGWLAPADNGLGGAVTGYNIWRHDGNSWSELVANTGSTTTSYTDTNGPSEGEIYQYTVRAINSAGRGEWSETSSWSELAAEVTSPTESAVPSAPRRLQVDAQSTGVVMVWLAPTDAGTGGAVTGYTIWRWYNNVWSQIETDTGSTGTNYTDTDALTVGDTYVYSIRAINGSGTGEWSETSSAVINPSLPSAPRRLVGDAQSSGVVLAWLAPVDEGLGGDITGYNIWRWHANVWTEIVADTSNTDTEYTDTTNLTVGDTYWYTLRAINAEGGGEWAETTGVVINPSLPSAPRRLIVSEGTTGIVLNWLVPIDTGLGGVITGYNIWRWDEVGGWLDIVDDTASTALTYIDTSTLDEGWHHYSVRAINASGEGEWSETSGVTTATNVPGPPQSLFAIDTASGIELSWTAPADDGGAPITGYRIWRSDGVDWTELVTDTGSVDTIYVDTMVKSIGDGIYFYRVQALTINGIGDFSAVASIQITGLLSVVMPTRSDNRVFGNWWVSLIPDVTNPNNDILLYEWSQDGGIIVSLTDSKDTYIKFPDGIDIDKNVSATLSITNIVTNYQIIDTIDFVVVAEPDRESLFYHGTTNEIPGVAWYKWAQIREDLDSSDNPTGDVGLVDSRLHETRAYVKISDENVLHTPAYVGLLTMKKNGTLLFNLAETPDDPGYGASPNPQLTDYAENNFGLALQLPNDNQYKWGFDDLTGSDTSDPYTFSSSSVSTAGQANNQSFRNALLDFWNARLVIVDRTSSFVDWVNLELIAINPSVSIDVVDTTADSESTQTISGLFDDFRNEFEEIGIMVETTSGTLGVLDRDDVSGFWSIPWSAPVVGSGTESSTITIIVENTFNRETEDSATILTRSTFQPIFPDNLVVSDIISIKPEDELKDVTNVVTVPVRQFDVTGEIELWSLQESIELGPEELRSFLITYPDDAAPRSHLAVNNWTKLRLREDPEFVFGPTPNTFGSKGGEVDEARRTRNLYAEQTPVWADEYKNSISLIVKLLGSSRSGEVYEAYSKGEWVEVSPIFPDYAANSQSDGNGDDRTNDLEIEVDDGGNTRKLIVKNSHTSDTIFLTTLRSRGRIIQEIQKITIEIRNESSVNAYGAKSYRSESQFLSTFDQAHEYGTHVLYLYSEPVLKIKVRFQANLSLFLTYSLKLSDRVALTREGETEEYFVEAIEHFIEEGLRHDMQLTLSSAPPGNVIILGTGPALGEGTLGR